MDRTLESIAVDGLSDMIQMMRRKGEEYAAALIEGGHSDDVIYEVHHCMNIQCLSLRFMCYTVKEEFGLNNDSIQFLTKTALELCNDIELKFPMSNEDLIKVKEEWFLMNEEGD